MSYVKKIWNWWQQRTHVTRHIIYLFIATRIIILIFGVLSITEISPIHKKLDAWHHWEYPKPLALKMWAVWDSSWYLDIATKGYSNVPFLNSQERNTGFLPFYPILIKIVSLFIGNNYFISALIVSNMSLLGAMFMIYKLMRLNFSEKISERTVKYLLLLPMSFVFSGIFTESLFVLLAISSIYFARKEYWWLSGVLGFCAAITRPTGLLLVVPLFVIWCKQIHNIRTISVKNLFDALSICLVPAGLASFFTYTYFTFGDFLLYVHVQSNIWKHSITNPFLTLKLSIINPTMQIEFCAYAVIISLLITIATLRKIPLEYTLLGICMLLLGPTLGNVTTSFRFITAVFPLAMSFGYIASNDEVDQVLAPSLAILQGCLLVFWVNTFWITI